MTEQSSLKLIAKRYLTNTTIDTKDDAMLSISPLGNGLINDTYLVKSPQQTFVLQKINQQVFTKPLKVVENANKIGQFLKSAAQNDDYKLSAIEQLKTCDGASYVDFEGNVWRALSYIDNCYTIEAVETNQQASIAATAFAQFSAALSKFDATKLSEIIPNFHHLATRISQLETSQQQTTEERLTLARSALDFCFAQRHFFTEVATLEKLLPLHVTHNDTKINNLLFDKHSDNAVAVIDLDTCMPGFLMNDFGDMVRTCCGTLAEDAKNIDQMAIRLDVFEALANAYIAGFDGAMTALEKQSLVIGALLLPLMIGIRFLTDFLNNDIYFHTQYSEHNLDRALNQFKLYQLLAQQRNELENIVKKTAKAA